MGLFDSLRKKDYSKLNCNEFAKEFKKLYEKLEKVQKIDKKTAGKIRADRKELEKFLVKQDPIFNEMEDLCNNWQKKCGRNDANFAYADFIIHSYLQGSAILAIPSGAADSTLMPWFKKIGEEHLLRGPATRGKYTVIFPNGQKQVFDGNYSFIANVFTL